MTVGAVVVAPMAVASVSPDKCMNEREMRKVEVVECGYLKTSKAGKLKLKETYWLVELIVSLRRFVR
jgi:hypothetical protein